jgi:predicted DNA-binding transcriptional regulator YafY
MVRQFADASLSEPMNAALDKLRAVLPRDRQEHVERLVRQTIIRGRGGHHNSPVDPDAQPWLLAVQRGVAQRRVLRILYRGGVRREETARDIEPLGVAFYGGAWYLVAWCRLRVDVRHFRVDRIRTLTMLDEPFARPDFSLSKHLEECDARHAMLPVRAWFADAAQARARRESYATLVEERRCDGGAEFSFTTWSHEWVARWLLSFGGDAEALSPPELRELVCHGLENTARRYALPVS